MFQKLDLQNFKGVTGTFPLASGTLIIGENFAGKSAILQALRASVLGYVPEPDVPKTSAGLKLFAEDFPMNVGVALPGSPDHIGFRFEKVKSTVKQTADNTLASLGVVDDPTRVLFDPSLFFGLSDSARISKACEIVRSEGGSPEQIDAALRQALGLEEVDGNLIGHESLVDSFSRWRRDVKEKAGTINELLTNSENFWKGEKSAANADKKRMQSTTEGVTDLSTIEKEAANLPPMADVEAKLAAARQKMSELNRQIATANADRRNAANILSHRRTLEQRAADVAQLTQQVEDLTKESAAADTKSFEATEAMIREKEALAMLRANAPTRETVAEAPVRTDSFAQHAGPGRYTVTVPVEVLETDGKFDYKLDLNLVTSWQEVRQPNEEDADRFRMAEYEHAEKLEAAEARWNEINAAYEAAGRAARTARNNVAAYAAKLSQAKEAAEELQKPWTAPTALSDVEVDALAAEISKQQAIVNEMDGTLRRLIAFDADKKRVADAARRREEIEKTIKLLDAACDIVAEKKQEVVSLSINAPLAVANKLGKGILRGPLVFEQGELGMRVGDKFRSCRTFSGAESAIVVTGLTAGLAARAKLRVLILDEVARVGVKRLPQLFENLEQLVRDGDIDQWIAVSPDNPVVEQAAKSAAIPNILTLGAVAA